MKRCNYWISEGIESHFSIEGPCIHVAVATQQLLDGHRQFGHSAPPIWTFISSTILAWISQILSVSYLSAAVACTNTGSTSLFPSKMKPFEQILDFSSLLLDEKRRLDSTGLQALRGNLRRTS